MQERARPPSRSGAPGAKEIVCGPGLRHRQANSTVPGIRLPELDLSCQIPVPSNVSRPSTNTRAWPASQQLSPSVPSSAIAEP